jgi:hypothetical protein
MTKRRGKINVGLKAQTALEALSGRVSPIWRSAIRSRFLKKQLQD